MPGKAELRQLGLDLGRLHKPPEIVARLAEAVQARTQCDAVVCLARDPVTGAAAGEAGRGPEIERLGPLARSLGEDACRTGDLARAGVAPSERPGGSPPGPLPEGLAVSLLEQDGALGYLAACWHRPGGAAAAEPYLRELARHAVAALANARVHARHQAALEELLASQALRVRTERLRALGEMAAGIAHDFNNLLAVILGRAQLLLLRTADPEVRRGLAVIEAAATEAAQTVRRIQEFTRLRQSRAYGPVDLGAVLRDAVELTRGRWKDEAELGGVRYTFTLALDEVPPVAGDVGELRELFANLLLNAMPEGGAVTLQLTSQADRVVVEVRDTGPGIPPEIRPRIFEPFFTTRGPRRAGLGLSVVYGIVRRHQGTIDVRSGPEGGAAFVVSLPRADALPPEGAGPGRAPGLGPPCRVLVVEDDPLVREVLVDLLRSAGHEPLAFPDGPTALAGLDPTRPPHLALVDLGLPGMSGFEVAGHLRQRSPGTLLVLVTGWAERLDPGAVRQSGIARVVAKPFEAEEILKLAAEAVARPARD